MLDAASPQSSRSGVELFRYPQFTKQGLELGRGSLVARAVSGADGAARLDLEKDFGRAAALLSAAYHRPVGIWEMGRLRAASEAWAKSDLALAHTILAQARLGRLQDDEDAPAHLRMAESFLDEGMAPFELLKALGLLAENWPESVTMAGRRWFLLSGRPMASFAPQLSGRR